MPLLLIVALASFAGCKELQSPSSKAMFEMRGAPMAAPPAPAGAGFASDSERASFETATAERKIARTARLTIEVQRVAEAAESARGALVKAGGFVADSRAFEDDSGRKSVEMTLKVPSDRLQATLDGIKMLGRVREEETSGEDVTEQYIDMEARLSNSKRLEARLQDLLGKESKNLKDVLDVEKELARVRETIEVMEARKRLLDSRTTLSTIDLTLTEPPGWGRGIFDPLGGSLQRSLSAFTHSLVLLVVVLAAAIPWIALIFLLMWLTLKVLRFWLRRKRELKAKKQDNNTAL